MEALIRNSQLGRMLSSFSTASPSDATSLIMFSQRMQISRSHNVSLTKIDFGLQDDANNGDQVEIEHIYYPDYSQIPAIRNTFVFLFLVEFFVCFIGNALVCLTVYQNKSMHSPVNYYIVNLGICDFIIGAFVLPTKLFELTAESDVNILSNSWCTLIRFFESVVVFVSVLTLVTISVERYYAVVYPMHTRLHLIDDRIRMVLLCSWVIPIIVASPNLYPAVSTPQILYSEYGVFTRRTCFDTFSNGFRLLYFLFLFLFMYFIPLVFIVVTGFFIVKVLRQKILVHPGRGSRAICLEQERQKVAKMMLVVVCAYIVFWSPYYWITLVTQLQSVNFFETGHYFFTMLTINLLCFTNSCVNPFVYFTMNGRFRKGIIAVIRSLLCFWKRRARYSARSNVSTSSCRGASLRQVILETPLRGHEMVHLNISERNDYTRSSTPFRMTFVQEQHR